MPINPEYRSGEIAYLLEHSEPELAIAVAARRDQLSGGLAESAHRPPIVALEEFPSTLPKPRHPAVPGQPTTRQ